MDKNNKRTVVLNLSKKNWVDLSVIFKAGFSAGLCGLVMVFASQGQISNTKFFALIFMSWILLFAINLLGTKQDILICESNKNYDDRWDTVLSAFIGFGGSIIAFFFTDLIELQILALFMAFLGTRYIQKSRFLDQIDRQA